MARVLSYGRLYALIKAYMYIIFVYLFGVGVKSIIGPYRVCIDKKDASTLAARIDSKRKIGTKKIVQGSASFQVILNVYFPTLQQTTEKFSLDPSAFTYPLTIMI